MRLDESIEALSKAEAYRECGLGDPSTLGPVGIRQTHISAVFLVGDRAWKLKKPVDLGFLDFSTLAKRRRFCEEELRINRRTAPEVYLGVDSVVRDGHGSLRVTADPGAREIVDVAVRMRRLPEGGLLDEQLDRLGGEAGDPGVASGRARLGTLLARFAPDLAEFHAACSTGEGIDEHGGPEGMRRQFEENLDRLRPFAGDGPSSVLSERRWRRLRERAFAKLESERSRLMRRVREGRVREGHGDLHAGNLCEVEGRLVAFDAIEFDRRLRCRDVACEVAHLAMDLDRRGMPAFAARWTKAYARTSGDREVVDLAPLFRFHYAVVRALVEAIRSRDADVPETERASSLASARRYADLATGYLLPPSLVFTCGLQGSGKSTVARAIARPLRALVLRSDEVRKRLAGIAIDDRRGRDRQGGDLYGEAWTGRTYDRLLGSAEAAMRRGRHVVVDAAFPTAERRAAFVDLARSRKAPWVLVEATCDREEIRRRLAARAADRREPSDADWAVYERAERAFERPAEIPETHRVAWSSDTPASAGASAGASAAIDRLGPV